MSERLVGRGLRVCFLFNTMRDASDARAALLAWSRLPDDSVANEDTLFGDRVAINVLGLGDFGEQYDVAVVVRAPCSQDRILRRGQSHWALGLSAHALSVLAAARVCCGRLWH